MQPACGLILLRSVDIRRYILQVHAVVEDDAGRQLTDEAIEFIALPIEMPLARKTFIAIFWIRVIHPQDVHRAVAGEQLAHLGAHVSGIATHVPHGVQFLSFEVVTQGVENVQRKVRVVPVNQRVIEADSQSLRTKGVHDKTQHVFAKGRARDLVICLLRIPQAKTVVMFGREHKILHARLAGDPGPLSWVEQIGVEMLEELLVILVAHPFLTFDPFTPRRKSV